MQIKGYIALPYQIKAYVVCFPAIHTTEFLIFVTYITFSQSGSSHSFCSIFIIFRPRSQAAKDGSKQGSTRLPKWPVVKFQKKEDPNKKLNWGDVPKLR